MASRTLRERFAEKADDELLDILLHRDAEQWRPEVFSLAEELLRSRGLTPPALPPPPVAVSDQPVPVPVGLRDLVVVATFQSVVAADAYVTALRAAGFAPVVLNEAVLHQDPSLSPGYGWVQLAVPENQATEVADFLAAANGP
jgi:hypothetical protein